MDEPVEVRKPRIVIEDLPAPGEGEDEVEGFGMFPTLDPLGGLPLLPPMPTVNPFPKVGLNPIGADENFYSFRAVAGVRG